MCDPAQAEGAPIIKQEVSMAARLSVDRRIAAKSRSQSSLSQIV
jgi:hypothetical protein